MAESLTLNADLVTAAGQIEELGAWLKSDMAAVMRQFPEQMSAATWFEATHGRRGDATETVPLWLKHQYGIDVAAAPKRSQTTDSLSAVATMISELLFNRAAVLQAAPIYYVPDEQTMTVAVRLAGTPTYGRSTSWPNAVTSGTVLLAKPIRYQHVVPAQATSGDSIGGSAVLDRIKPNGPAHLAALTWVCVNGAVRCMDWLRPTIDPTGVDEVDEQLERALKGGDQQLPNMIFNGEWHRGVQTTGGDVDSARHRIQQAAGYDAAGEAPRWNGHGVIADETGLLVPTLAAVLADCVASGLLVARDQNVRIGRRRRTVTILQPTTQ